MKKLLLALAIASAGTALFASSVLAQEIDGTDAVPESADSSGLSPRVVAKPTDLHDWRGWSLYLSSLIAQHSQGIARNYLTAYFVPAGEDSDEAGSRQRQLDYVKNARARGIPPGYAIAFGGPSSHVTADFVLAAFKDLPPDSLKGVTLMFIGVEADKRRVLSRWQACGADTRFVAMTATQPLASELDEYAFVPPPPPSPPGMDASDAKQYPSGRSGHEPIYPGFEAIYGLTGKTMLLILVGKTGEPRDIKVTQTSGVRDLDAAALNAAIQWRFNPALKNGVTVDAYVRVPVSFNLDPAAYDAWPQNYLGARIIWDDAPIPYAKVGDALNAVAAQVKQPVYDDQANHAHTYIVYDEDGNMRERWYFMDVSSAHAMAVRYSFAGMPGSPQIKVRTLCDNPALCMNRTSWVMDGPHSLSVARQGSGVR